MLTDAEEDYARGSVPFLGVTVFLDSRPLIPRSETEFWVERAIAEMNESPRHPLRVLDLFAGSGAIGLAVLKHVPDTQVTFAEKEVRHLSTIAKSVRGNEIDSNRASIVESDVWSGVAGLFEYVFANPPYISRARGTISPDALEHEPHEALFADDDGFAYIASFLEGLGSHLAPGGVAYLEHEPYQSERLRDYAAQRGFDATTFRDQYDVDRYTRVSKKL